MYMLKPQEHFGDISVHNSSYGYTKVEITPSIIGRHVEKVKS